jgi:hypothetical protein
MRLHVLTMICIATAAPSLGGAHDWYTGLRSPTGVECCGGRDCRPVPFRLNPDTRQEEIEANEAWRPVEHDKVLPFPSPDGGAHACWDDPWGGKRPVFRCIILPGTAALDRPEGVVTLDGVPRPGVR